MQEIDWTPVKNSERTARNKFNKWVRLDTKNPFKNSVMIAPIIDNEPSMLNARWIDPEQIVQKVLN